MEWELSEKMREETARRNGCVSVSVEFSEGNVLTDAIKSSLYSIWKLTTDLRDEM